MDIKLKNFLKYGVGKDLATKAIAKGLNISTIKNTSKQNLIEKYNLLNNEAHILKSYTSRKPIDERVLQELLERSAFTCCICRGVKSHAYIVHHIEYYHKSQNNNYENLAVLCPADHELAHREGLALAHKITPKNIKSAKAKWEKIVEENSVRRAAQDGEVLEIDYINVDRVLELVLDINEYIPETIYTQTLLENKLILTTGDINPELYERFNINKYEKLNFFSRFGSTMLIRHYFELFRQCLNRLQFHDLDDLLTLSSIKKGVIGEFCFYVGGLYGRTYKGNEINASTEDTIIHFRRKPFYIEWKVKPMFITSTTAHGRISERPIYLVYGKILNITEQEMDGNKRLKIEIRPYAFGIPNKSKRRKPAIHYRDIDIDIYDYEEE